MVDNEEIDLIADAVVRKLSKQIYNIMHSFSWYTVELLQMGENDFISSPTYEEAIRD